MRKLDSEKLRMAGIRLLLEAGCETTPQKSADAFRAVAEWLLAEAAETDARNGALSGVTPLHRPSGDKVFTVTWSRDCAATVRAPSANVAVERAREVTGVTAEPLRVEERS